MSTHVLVASPLGPGGKGGIDRIMDAVREGLSREDRPDLRVRFAATRGGGHVLASAYFMSLFVLQLVFLRLARRCDVLHVNVAPRGSNVRKALVCYVARTLGVRTVVHLHGSGYDEFFDGATPFMRRLVHEMFSRADCVVVLGSKWREFVLRTKLSVSEKVVTLPNATRVRHRAFEADSSGVRILFLGIHGLRKGTPQLVEALASLNHLGGWSAILAGNGEVDESKAAACRLGVQHRVSLPGWTSESETASLLATCDILVLPSFAENLPMSVIEGMAAGLAVVTTPVGATPDIIKHGETGLLIAPGDVSALASAIERLIVDKQLRRKLGEAAMAFQREHLEIGSYVHRLSDLWQDVHHSGARIREKHHES